MKGSAARDNEIRGLKLKSRVENSDNDSGIDALSEVEDGVKEKREKTSGEKKQKDKKDVLPIEVCF